VQKIRLFLSFPGDVEVERQKAHSMVAQVNRMLGHFYDVSLKVIDWKIHVAPKMGRAQEVINEQIGKYNVFVETIWKRFGNPKEIELQEALHQPRLLIKGDSGAAKTNLKPAKSILPFNWQGTSSAIKWWTAALFWIGLSVDLIQPI